MVQIGRVERPHGGVHVEHPAAIDCIHARRAKIACGLQQDGSHVAGLQPLPVPQDQRCSARHQRRREGGAGHAHQPAFAIGNQNELAWRHDEPVHQPVPVRARARNGQARLAGAI